MDRHTNTHTETKLKYFDGHGCLSQSEESEYIIEFYFVILIYWLIKYISQSRTIVRVIPMQ
jgi:hypothetical protein